MINRFSKFALRLLVKTTERQSFEEIRNFCSLLELRKLSIGMILRGPIVVDERKRDVAFPREGQKVDAMRRLL
jgi:uncharacterized RDD family membrane protein YckC